MDTVVLRIAPIVHAVSHLDWLDSYYFKALLSFALIFIVLMWLAAIYRGGAGDEEIEKPVALALLANSEEQTLTLAPRHLKERSTHHSKAPRVQFYLQVPGCGKYDYRALVEPLRLSIRGRNNSTVYDQEYARDMNTRPYSDGGQLGITSQTRDKLEEYFGDLFRKEGRRFDADTATFVIKLKYPAHLNISYLLKEHPDTSVRIGAWIFILTSLFSILQEVIFRS